MTDPKRFGPSKYVQMPRSFLFVEASKLARVELQVWLFMIESIKVRCQGIFQRIEMSVRIQYAPRMLAGLGRARLEHHHESIKTVDNVLERATGDVVTLCQGSIVVSVL